MNTPPLIDPEFRDYIAPLTPEEYAGLEASLLSEGCRDPLVVWTEENTLIDGHHRYRLCEKHNIPYQLVYRSFASRYHVTLWMIENQLGRRNLSAMQASYLRGKRYQAEKQAHGGNRKSRDHNDLLIPGVTAEKLAEEYKVSSPTIKRDEQIAEALDKLDHTTRRDILSSDLEVTKKEVLLLGSLPANRVASVVEKIRKSDGKRAHVANNSGENEWYTPPEIIEAARLTMGSIDLDPASSHIANQTVNAKIYYTLEDDGLQYAWQGCVFMNPPYSQPLIAQFSEKLVQSLPSITHACVLVNNATETAWFQNMVEHAAALCFIRGRVRFISGSGQPNSTPLQGQIVLYFGNRTGAFRENFESMGVISYGR